MITPSPNCPAFAMVCLEPFPLDVTSGGSATRMLVIAGNGHAGEIWLCSRWRKKLSRGPVVSNGGAYIASPNCGARLGAFVRARAPNLIG